MSGGLVVVGAGLGGQRLVEKVREFGYAGPLALIGAEAHPPYDRPPLSKAVLRGETESVELAEESFYDAHDVEMLLGTGLVAVDSAARTLTLTDGERTWSRDYDRLVLATGLVPRTLPGTDGVAGVFTLRTIDEALALRAAAKGAVRAVVVGAGFIGCEVAASLTEQGVAVQIVEAAPAPMYAALGEEVGNMVGRILVERGVTIRTSVSVARVTTEGGAVTGVELSDGAVVPADLLVVGIGSTPAVDYLDGSGIALADRADGGGILCDATGSTSTPDVWALGDAANWASADGGRHRAEHWNAVVDQATVIASVLAGAGPASLSVPYFWSDQFQFKVQAIGMPGPDAAVRVVEDDGTRFLAHYVRAGRLVGVVGVGRAGAVNRLRGKVAAAVPIDDV